ncbi:uncharacterized protein LOC130626088 [Hydractinia symbiolongicarpus]|uniref:uncharacterized protein LOC130626088 n=1 Tax=Hydractinia symbiolongicarpus TaxID=13093 RepID=UPI00254E6C4E|nr:uncharacterized protein LOC130626088 [Hydractinia symbiolongicarpus]XP_057297178.1 uncharacterized protein LOC130626088 [Hydractinia symbiolongicarpus]
MTIKEIDVTLKPRWKNNLLKLVGKFEIKLEIVRESSSDGFPVTFPFVFTKSNAKKVKAALLRYITCLKGQSIGDVNCPQPIVKNRVGDDKSGKVLIILQTNKARYRLDVNRLIVSFEKGKEQLQMKRSATSRKNYANVTKTAIGKDGTKKVSIYEECKTGTSTFRCTGIKAIKSKGGISQVAFMRLKIYGVQKEQHRRSLDYWSVLKIVNLLINGLTAIL